MTDRIFSFFILFIVIFLAGSCTHYPRPPLVSVPGIDLESVHRRLENAGFSPGPYDTEDLTWLSVSLERFQKFAGVEISGNLDADTWKQMQKLYDPKVSGSSRNSEVPGENKFIRIITPSKRIHFPIRTGESVYALELAECSDISGDWVLFFEGTVLEKMKDSSAVRLEKRFAYRHRHEEEGIDDSNWWCIPRKRHCHSPVKFNDWGGKYRPEQIIIFENSKLANSKNGRINILTEWLAVHCGE